MESAHTIHQYNVDILLALVMVITAVAMATKWIKVPYSIALVLVGLAIGIFKILPPVEMTPELILVCVLPPLLFETAWNIDLNAIKRDWLPITVLATVGVLFCMLITAGCMNLIGGAPLGPALVFGSLIAATDVVSVSAILHSMRLRGRLTTLLEGESIFNDGTSMVLFHVVLAVVVAGQPFSVTNTAGEFVIVSAGGCLVGLLVGLLASKITSLFDDHLLETTLTIVVAYGSFLLGEQLHVSPVMSVVVAGMVYGTYGSRVGMSPTTRMAINQFWQYLAFVVNSLVFLLIGLQVNLELLWLYRQQILVGIVAVTLARVVTIYGLCPFMSTRRSPIPDSWRHLIVWGGLRGASCMALALSLPRNFEMREEIIVTTFGVVLFTLLFHGTTLGALLKFLNLRPVIRDTSERFNSLRAQLIADKTALNLLEELRRERSLTNKNYAILRGEVERTLNEIEQEIDALELEDQEREALELRATRIRLLESQDDCLQNLSRTNVISEVSYLSLREKIAMQLEQLQEDLDGQMQIVQSYKSGAFPVVDELSSGDGNPDSEQHHGAEQLPKEQDGAVEV
jgi:monovalent cation:H+ antiporter, CPA1 family